MGGSKHFTAEVAMKPLTYPLKPQMKRAEVSNLHQALSALGFTIAGAEKRTSVLEHQSARPFILGEPIELSPTVIEYILWTHLIRMPSRQHMALFRRRDVSCTVFMREDVG
jgi:hypothetical protein